MTPESVTTRYLGVPLTIRDHEVVVHLARPVRVASVPTARRLIRGHRRALRTEAE